VNNNETICALSTPAGMGAIALIRVSGEDAIPVCERLIRLKGGKSGLKDVIANSARLGGFIYDATIYRRGFNRDSLPWFKVHTAESAGKFN
jgi:tRNA modification GTPase